MNLEELDAYFSEDPYQYTSDEKTDKNMITDAGEHFCIIYDSFNHVVQFNFTTRPSGLTRAILKQHNFRWNDRLNAWCTDINAKDIDDRIKYVTSDVFAKEVED